MGENFISEDEILDSDFEHVLKYFDLFDSDVINASSSNEVPEYFGPFDSDVINMSSTCDEECALNNVHECFGLFDSDVPVVMNTSLSDDVNGGVLNNPSPGSVSSWINEIEIVLMNDEEKEGGGSAENNEEFCNEFLSDILVDFPAAAAAAGDVSSSDDKNSNSNSYSDSDGKVTPEIDTDYAAVRGEEEGDDPVSKKRKRQMRNRDAALRSRERKKVYVRDLELKSKYLEGECRRLGRLLQCCFQENQALRFSLRKSNEASGASMTKQESAVLVMESLLLGSLFWFLGIMCLFNLPKLLLSNLDTVPLEGVENKGLESVALRVAGNKVFRSLRMGLSFKSRRCKASRTRMRTSFVGLGILV